MRLTQLVLLSAVLASVTAHAQDGAGSDALKATLEQDLMKPLAQRESTRSKYSRAALPPQERRVRVLDSALKEDARGEHFATFAIDSRWSGGKWTQDSITGCIYPKDGSIFVNYGDSYRAAAALLGKKTEKAPATICRVKSGSS